MIKVYCIHPFVTDVASLLTYLRLENTFDLSWDEESPDILFASEWIYYKQEFFLTFKHLYDIATIKVFLAYEAISPDWNIFDYAIGFDDDLIKSDRFIRAVNPYRLYNSFVTRTENEINTVEKARLELQKKDRFCNFLYSNANAHEMRDKLFFEISKYKKVDSLGRHLNNVGTQGTSFEGHSGECVPMKSRYKFSIASENASFTGYTSEKILTSLEAHTVPIYFGNPHICDDINPECFINAGDYGCFEELVEFVRKVDSDDELWCQMISRPWMTPAQKANMEQRTTQYYKSMNDLLTGDVEEKRRLAIGTHQNLYRKKFIQSTYPKDFVPGKRTLKYYVKIPFRFVKRVINGRMVRFSPW